MAIPPSTTIKQGLPLWGEAIMSKSPITQDPCVKAIIEDSTLLERAGFLIGEMRIGQPNGQKNILNGTYVSRQICSQKMRPPALCGGAPDFLVTIWFILAIAYDYGYKLWNSEIT